MSEVFTLKVDGRERPYRLELINGTPLLLGYGVNLAGADLSGAKLAGLDLRSANLSGASLVFTDLSGCNLAFANLTGANAAAADFCGANLLGAVTKDTALIGADLRGATFDKRTVRGAYLCDELAPGYLTRLGVTNPSEATEPPNDLLRDTPAPATSVAPTMRQRGDPARNYDGLLQSLSVGITQLVTSETWTQYLEVQSRFHAYSPNNVMLIMLQNPYATRVAGYRAWQALDHQVMAKESALRIFAPMKYKRENALEGDRASEVRGFKLVPVFDISQTEGPDLPDVVNKLEGLAPEGVFDRLTEFAHSIGFRVERPESLLSGANGDTTHASGLIRVISSNSEVQQAKTLAHEIGHALLHDPESVTTKNLTRGLKELEAESTAYVICTALGMDTSDYSFGYVAGWVGGAPEATQGIKESSGRIQKAAKAVLKAFEVEEPLVEATNNVSIEMAAERSADVDAILRTGERRTEDLVELERIQEFADSSDGHVQVVTVDLSLRDTSMSNYRPLSGWEPDVMGSPADVSFKLGL